MLSELGASPSSNSGLVSSSTEPHLKLVIASVHLCNERRNGSERGLAQCTATWVAGALVKARSAITYGARHRVLHREQTFSTENRIHVIRKLVPGLRTASDKASVASQCSLLPRRTIRSTGKGAIARRFKPALHAVSPH